MRLAGKRLKMAALQPSDGRLSVHSHARSCCSGEHLPQRTCTYTRTPTNNQHAPDRQHRIVGRIHRGKSADVEPPVMSVLVRACTVGVGEQSTGPTGPTVQDSPGFSWSLFYVRHCDLSHRP